MNKTLAEIESDLLQTYSSMVVMRSNPEHSKENILAVASKLFDVYFDLCQNAHNNPTKLTQEKTPQRH